MLPRLSADPLKNLKPEEISVRSRFYLPPFLLSITVLLACSLVSFGQSTRDKFVISAKAGGINAITGGANVSSRGESGWQQLMVTDDLNSGDHVRTDSDGRVEVLLNPGAYLRLGGNSEIELVDNSLANLEVRLLRGTAIVEATGADGLELNIGISTPHTRLAIVRQGLYRLNVIPEDLSELIVRKGSVILSDTHKKKDDVEVWSKDRAKALAQANQKLTNRIITTAFSSFRDPFRDTFFPFDSRALGLWFFNPRFGCYTFLPFYLGLGSPYGSIYSSALYLPYVPASGYPYGYTPGSTRPSGGPSYPRNSVPPTTGGGNPANSGGSRPSTPPSNGGFGNGGGNGGFSREPRMINPETGNPAPRKNLEKMPGQP